LEEDEPDHTTAHSCGELRADVAKDSSQFGYKLSEKLFFPITTFTWFEIKVDLNLNSSPYYGL